MLKLYKLHFRNLLSEVLEVLGPQENVLDCGSASGKFRSYFDTDEYLGIDIREFAPIPRVRYRPTDKFLTFDLTDKDFPSLGKFAMVVCTHTIENVSKARKLDALANMEKVMRDDSLLLIQLTYRDLAILEDYLNENFELVLVIKYRGFFSLLSLLKFLISRPIRVSPKQARKFKGGRLYYGQEFIFVARKSSKK